MKLLWREPIFKFSEGEDGAVYNFYNTPFIFGARAVWFYDFYLEDYRNVFAASVFDLNNGANKRYSIIFEKGKGVPVPHCWEITEREGGYFIDPFKYHEPSRPQYCLFFDGKHIEKIERRESRGRLIFPDQKVFCFGNLRVNIAKNATRKLECTNSETGEKLWTFTFVGYLYTDIFEYDGVIYFGKAGQGGRFYGLNLLSGEVLHDVNTRGTAHFTRFDEKFYFPSANGNLMEYNPKSKGVRVLDFGKGNYVSDDVDIFVAGGRLYAVVAERVVKSSGVFDFSLACVEP